MALSATGKGGMAVAPHALAAQAGRGVLADGGTAVEAAVAMAATLAVVYPHMTGLGGDSFWLIAEPDGAVHAVDGCGRAAAAALPALYEGLTEIPWRGPLAALTVNGAVSGWEAALATAPRRLPLSRLLGDAVAHAEAGVAVTQGHVEIALAKGGELRTQPGAYAAIFEPEGRPLRAGDRLRQHRLAETLQRLATDGLDDIYRGALALDIAADLAAVGSPLCAADLAAHQPTSPAPLHASIRAATLYNTPAPTQGAASLLILTLFDRMAPDVADGFDHIHRLVECTKQAFLYRDAVIEDPAAMTADPQALLDDAAALDALAARIDCARALPWPQPPAAGDTTWFGAADAEGRVVSAIQSTYFEFGSGVVLPRTGLTWQNRGASFSLAPRGRNRLAPGRKPFHTLNPALARFDDGRVMAYGTMGGEGQPQTQAALFTRYARYGQPLADAIAAPRWLLGRTWGDASVTLKLEDRVTSETVRALLIAGHDVEKLAAFTSTTGHAGALVCYPDARVEGAADPRSDGAACGF